jgi:hypothetical protein
MAARLATRPRQLIARTSQVSGCPTFFVWTGRAVVLARGEGAKYIARALRELEGQDLEVAMTEPQPPGGKAEPAGPDDQCLGHECTRARLRATAGQCPARLASPAGAAGGGVHREPARPPEAFPHQRLLVVDALDRVGGAPHCFHRNHQHSAAVRTWTPSRFALRCPAPHWAGAVFPTPPGAA